MCHSIFLLLFLLWTIVAPVRHAILHEGLVWSQNYEARATREGTMIEKVWNKWNLSHFGVSATLASPHWKHCAASHTHVNVQNTSCEVGFLWHVFPKPFWQMIRFSVRTCERDEPPVPQARARITLVILVGCFPKYYRCMPQIFSSSSPEMLLRDLFHPLHLSFFEIFSCPNIFARLPWNPLSVGYPSCFTYIIMYSTTFAMEFGNRAVCESFH